jgi:signal transduction histidine kinase
MNRRDKMADSPGIGSTRTNFTADELLHFSRLITIGQLSACFAHEIKNPLMLIKGHLRLFEEGLPADDPLRINFEVIDRATRRIEEMAKWLLDFSRDRTPRTEKFDVAELVSDAVHFTQPYFRSQNIDVETHVEPGLPLVPVDRWQMIQALVNVLQNAVDAMAGVDRRVLSIGAGIEGNQVRIAISDTGTGIAPASLPFIFVPFFTTKGEHGTGLGLCITKQVIEQHAGTIAVQTGDCGATFIISLPL